MTCLIEVSKSGRYCCRAGSEGQLQGFVVNNDPLILKAANLPVTPIECQVNDQWVDTGRTIGGDNVCVILCKPGCYRLPIDCADYEGEAPAENPTELCYVCDPSFDKMGALLEILAESEASGDVSLDAILDCLAELKLLVAANNDATALAMLIAQIEALCEKLLTVAENQEEICTKLLDVIAALNALCAKIEAGNEGQIEILGEIKTCLTAVLEGLAEICTKLDTANQNLEAICTKLDAILALLTAQLAAVLVCLNQLKAIGTDTLACLEDLKGLNTEQLEKLCELVDNLPDVVECCDVEDPENRDRWCQTYNAAFPVGNGDDAETYTIGIGGVYADLPNPYAAADVIAALNSLQPAGNWQFLTDANGNNVLCRFDGPGAVTTRASCCQERRCYLSAATGVQTFIAAGEPECTTFTRTWGKYEEPIADILQNMDATLQSLLQCPRSLNLECLKKRTFCIGYDNGRFPGSSENDCGAAGNFIRFSDGFEVVGWNVNGTVVGAGEVLGPFAGWTEQLQGWADFMNANDPNFVDGECFAEFGFNPAPVWRYAKITCCNPTAKYGPLLMRRVSDGCLFTVYPILAEDTLETVNRYATITCEGEKAIQFCDAEGNDIEAPTMPNCFVPCDFIFDDYIYGPEVQCEQDIYNLCDAGTEPPTAFVAVVTDCGAGRETEAYTLESWTTATNPDELVAYEVTGDIVDCATGAPFEFPESLDEAILAKLCEIKDCLVCEDDMCPELVVGPAEFTTESTNGQPGDAVSFPVTTLPNETSDFAVPVALPADLPCEIPADTPMVVRWNFDHEIDPSTNHTGFNISASDGTNAIGTIVGQSNAPATVHVGPGVTPHTGPRDDYWVDVEVTAAQLAAGIMLQTSAFGTITDETETVFSQSVELMTDLSQFGCC